MKKTVNLSFLYAILAMTAGVFYREFTKFKGFEGQTTLSFVHTHFFFLGMIMFLIVTLCIARFSIQDSKKYKGFMVIYNVGVCMTSVMLLVRGVFQVNQTVLSKGMDASISGIAGIGHLLTGVGIVLFFLILKERVKDELV